MRKPLFYLMPITAFALIIIISNNLKSLPPTSNPATDTDSRKETAAGTFSPTSPIVPSGDKEITIGVSSPAGLAGSTVSGTIISGYSKDDKLVFSAGFPLTWNTYSANTPGEIHVFVRTENMDSPFETLPRAVAGVHNSYVIRENKNLFIFNHSSRLYYPLTEAGNNKYIAGDQPVLSVSPAGFKNLGFQYSHGRGEEGDWGVTACKITSPEICDRITMTYEATVYAYGGNETTTVVVNNVGEILFHDKDGWCRGQKTSDGLICDKTATSPLTNRGLQLYSSIKTNEGTLLGEHPSGRFWLLGNGTLKPTAFSPYNEDKNNNLELQSVSNFCGDLYAGFWPYGEVWKKSPDENSVWEKSVRLFSHPDVNISGIPYQEDLIEKAPGIYENSGFFGQRVTSMVNHHNSLFVASGNYGNWYETVSRPPFMTDEQANEYGLVRLKTDSNCLTTVIDDNIAMKITIDSNNISVYNNDAKIAGTKLHDFDINRIDHFRIGQGVFGALSDKDINVKVTETTER